MRVADACHMYVVPGTPCGTHLRQGAKRQGVHFLSLAMWIVLLFKCNMQFGHCFDSTWPCSTYDRSQGLQLRTLRFPFDVTPASCIVYVGRVGGLGSKRSAGQTYVRVQSVAGWQAGNDTCCSVWLGQWLPIGKCNTFISV